MSARVYHATSPAGLLTIAGSSAAVAAFILAGQFEHAARIWGTALIILAVAVIAWRFAVLGRLRLEHLDQWAWAIMISHTVIINIPRDATILAEDLAPSAAIAIQIVIWGVLLLFALARSARDLGRLRSLLGPTARYATMFFLLAVASSAYSNGPLITLVWSFKLGTILLLCTVLFDRTDPRQTLQRFVDATQLGLMLIVLQFLVVAVLSPGTAVNTTDLRGIWRAGGEVMASTKLSAAAGLAAALQLVDLFMAPRTMRKTVLFILLVGIMAAALGRGGILATALGMTMVLAAFRRLRLIAAATALVIIVLLFSPWLAETSGEILTRRQSEAEMRSLTGRTYVWSITVDLIRERPLLGWGYVSGSRIELSRLFPGGNSGGSHNAYLEVVLALGAIGALVLGGLLIRICITLARALRSRWTVLAPSVIGIQVLKLAVILLVLLVEGMFESSFSGPPRFEATLLFGVAFCCDGIAMTGDSGRRLDSFSVGQRP